MTVIDPAVDIGDNSTLYHTVAEQIRSALQSMRDGDRWRVVNQLPSKIERINALMRRRVQLAAELAEVDRLLEKAADAIEREPSHRNRGAAVETPAVDLPRLPHEDRRSVGSMMEMITHILLNADRGYTRLELRAELAKTPKFKEMMEKNVNNFYNNLLRGLRPGGKFKEVGGLLYHVARAPLEEPPAEAEPERLPANVTLFSKAKDSDG